MAANATACGGPFAASSPAELREAILLEDVPQFDRSYREALDAVPETLCLNELEKFLAHWRRIAWSATACGHDHWRVVLARAEHILRTGEPPPAPCPRKRSRISSGRGWAGRCTGSEERGVDQQGQPRWRGPAVGLCPRRPGNGDLPDLGRPAIARSPVGRWSELRSRTRRLYRDRINLLMRPRAR